MLLSFLAALAAAIVFITFVQTWGAYGALPDRVPLGLTWNGVPRSLGPRPMIWVIVAAQIFAACIMAYADYAIATHAPGAHGSLLGSLLASVCVLAILWRAQTLLIASAKHGNSPVPMGGFWVTFGFLMLIVLIDVFAIG